MVNLLFQSFVGFSLGAGHARDFRGPHRSCNGKCMRKLSIKNKFTIGEKLPIDPVDWREV